MANLLPIPVRLVTPDWTDSVPAPAHDSLTPPERRRYVEDHPHSYLRVTRAPEDLPEGRQWDVERAITSSKASLNRLLDSGAFTEPGPPSFHLYRLSNAQHTQVGLVCGVEVDEYETGRLRIHEQIRQSRADHLATHLEALQVQSSPIALAHPANAGTTALIDERMASAEPIVDFTASDGLHQQVWVIDDAETIEQIRSQFTETNLYLIDGHHRAAAAAAYRKRSGQAGSETMLCAIFSADNIRNEAFHRCLIRVDAHVLLRQVRANFAIREVNTIDEVLARSADELALRADDSWFLVTVPGGSPDDSAASHLDDLDPVRLQQKVLGPLLSIDTSSPSSVLDYRHGLADRSDLEVISQAQEPAVWVMRPVPISTLMQASDAGLIMPPKSTYFLPKVRSGVFLRAFT